MSTCTTRFEIEEEQLAFTRSLSIHEEGETGDLSAQTEDVEPISDTEEDEEVSRISVRASKRRGVLSDHSDLDEGNLSDYSSVTLSTMPESQVRASGRCGSGPGYSMISLSLI
jgi:hypothetical protein